MQIRYQDIEGLRGDWFQGFCDVGSSDNPTSLVWEGHSPHVTNGIIVIHEQELMHDGPFACSEMEQRVVRSGS